jgi:hypothetical protein
VVTLLAGFFITPPAFKTLEYLIRRYKIHVYNVDAVRVGSKHQLMTASTCARNQSDTPGSECQPISRVLVAHVTNLTPPGSEQP